MAKHDYIFVDESGDPGYRFNETSGNLLSSRHYTTAAFHLSDDAFHDLDQHLAAFRYYTGFSRELKIPSHRPEFKRLLDPIRLLSEGGKSIWASVVYVDKIRYIGSYLKPGGRRPASPVRFRNYMLRRLLEHHFLNYSLQSNQYDLVLDRVELTPEEIDNLRRYISANRNFPTPTHITHASSIYVEGLQVVHHIASGFKDVTCGGKVPNELSFVSTRDLTTNQYVRGDKDSG